MPKRKTISIRKIILGVCSVFIGIVLLGFLPNLLQADVEKRLQDSLGENYHLFLYGLLAFAVVVMLITYFAGEEDTEEKKAATDQDLRSQFLQNLKALYQKRLHDKMQGELNFEIKLNLTYTTEGNQPETIEDFFIIQKESSAGDFDRLFNNYTKRLWRLLILGEPGAGKSILLLRFGLRLIEMAEADPKFPIPVLLDLASWRDENQTFETWIEKNLPYIGGSFAVSKEYAGILVESKIILPLLDGFDEIREPLRNSCLRQLLPYLDKVKNARPEPLPEVIICSRIIEYHAAEDAPVFAALKIQPLTAKDVNDALRPLANDNFPAAKRLQNTLRENPGLYPAVTSAFFVHTLLDISQQEQVSFGAGTREELQTAITAHYIRSEMEKITDFPLDKSKKWLGWLAWMMKHMEGSITFELTDLQPRWARLKYAYPLVLGLVGGLVGGLVFSLVLGLILGLVLGLVFSLVLGLVGDSINTQEIKVFSLKNLSWKIVRDFLVVGLVVGLVGGLVFGLVLGLVLGLVGGLVLGLVGVLVFGLVVGLVLGLVLGLSVNESFPKTSNPYKRLLAQFWRDVIQVALILCLGIGAGVYAVINSYFGFLWGLFWGALAAVLSSPVLQHFCLRWVLYREKSLPWKLVTFLDHISTNTGLLLKDGGQWRFRHQLIHDHLAAWFEEHHPELLRPAYLEKAKKERSEKLAPATAASMNIQNQPTP
ncbi:MAG: hypothetical protein KDD27_25000 [Saprospiraceae bacterium]|nr:hypothetical protein [Saprospiraceae bacterium]